MATYYKLDKINALADNDKDFITVLIQTFLEEIPEDAHLLKEAVENQNKQQTYQVAHKMKPTLELFGLDAYNAIIALQDWGKNTKELEDVNLQLNQVLANVDNASIELRKDFNL